MHNDIFPYAKPNPYLVNVKDNRSKIKEAMGKAKKSTDGDHLDPETIEDIYELYNNYTTRKDVSKALDTRTDVLRVIKNGIVLAEYPLAPFKTNKIIPIKKAA